MLYRGSEVYRTRTINKSLNPLWDEGFSFLIEDPTQCLQLGVYDFDRFSKDEYMGGGEVEMDQMKWFE